MEFLEKDLEQLIWEADKEKLNERGLYIPGKLKRQLRIGNYGVADLVSFEREIYYESGIDTIFKYPFLRITVYELKKEKIGISAFLQAINYCKGIKTYIEKNKPNMSYSLNVVLVGKSIDNSGSFIYLEDLINQDSYKPTNALNSVNFYTYKYSLEGLKFKSESAYNLTNKGF